MQKNSFIELQEALEARYEANFDPRNLMQLEQQVQTMHVFGQLAELFIPIAAGAAVTMATGSDVKVAPAHTDLPDFEWRYKTLKEETSQANHPRDRFQPLIPY